MAIIRTKMSENHNPFFHFFLSHSMIILYICTGSSSNLVVISFLFQLSSSFLILLKVVDMFAF